MENENRTIKIPSSEQEGRFLSGQYCAPKGTPKALVLMFHGITSDRDEWGFYSRMSDKFTESGISSIRVDFRGHGASDWLVEEISLDGFLKDIQATFDEARQLVPLESVPIFLVGTSFGGGLTLLWANDNSTSVSGVMLCAPVFDYFHDIREYTAVSAKDSAFLVYGGEMELPANLLDESRNFRLGSMKISSGLPVTIFHGDKDDDVPFSSSLEFQSFNPSVELINIPNSGHGFAAPDDEELEFPETIENHNMVYNNMVNRINEWRGS